jgi:hypothetical protein
VDTKIYSERTMKPIRSITLLTLAVLFLLPTTPLFADSVTIGANGDLSFSRPFCGT